MRRSILSMVAIFLAQLAGGANAAAAEDASRQWTLVSDAANQLNASIHETVWQTTRPPGGEYDKIELPRYRTNQETHSTLLYLPGTNMNGEIAIGDEDYNLWIYLVRRAVEVYALDYRTRFVPNVGVEDLSFMRAWSLESFIDDAAEAAALIRREWDRQRIFIAGFSRGVSIADVLA